MKKETEAVETKKERREKRGANVLIIQIILSLVCIGVGGLFIYMPQTETKFVCYIFCVGLIAAAVVEIARFFISQAYNRLYDYSFAIGILLLILGICGLLRINDLVKHFQLSVGMITLVIGAVILQGMVQLNVLDNLLWILLMVFTTVILVGSVLLIIDVQAVIALVPGFVYWLLLCSGIASLLSLLIVALALFLHRRKRRKIEAAAEEAEPENVLAAGLTPFEEDIPEVNVPAEKPANEAAPASGAVSGTAAAMAAAAAAAKPTAAAKPVAAAKPAAAAVKPAAEAVTAAAAVKPAAEAAKPAVAAAKPAAEAVSPAAAAKPAAEAVKPAPAPVKVPEEPKAPLGATQVFPPISDRKTFSAPAEEPFDAGKAAEEPEEDIFVALNPSGKEPKEAEVFTLPEIIPPEDL